MGTPTPGHSNAIGGIAWQRWAFVAALHSGVILVVLLWRPGGTWVAEPVAGSLAVLPPQLIALGAIAVLRRRLTAVRTRRLWTLIGCAVAAWLAGDVLWLIDDATGTALSPVGLAAEAAYLAGYGLAMVGLLMYPARPSERFGVLRAWLDVFITLGGILTLGWVIFGQPLATSAADRAIVFGAALYPLADVCLLILLANLFLTSELDRQRAPLGLVAAGLAAFALTDLGYTYLVMEGRYASGSLIDAGWVAGNWLIALGAIYQSEMAAAGDSAGPTTAARVPKMRRRQLLLPVAATLAVMAYTLWSLYATGSVEPVTLWAVIILGVALVARQGMLAGEAELVQYAQLVHSTAIGAFVCDARGQLLLVNPALLAAVGCQRERDLVGQSLGSLLAPPAAGDSGAPTLERLLVLGLSGSWAGKVALRRPNDEYFAAQVSLSAVQTTSAAQRVLAGTVQDLSEQERQAAALQAAYEQVAGARQQLEALNRQLEQKVEEKTRDLSEANTLLAQQNEALQTLDKLKSEFVSLVSHELRAPLTNIAGGIESVLMRPAGLPPRAHESLALVQAEIGRLSQMVETILDLSSLDAGGLRLATAPVRLQRVVEAMQVQFAASGSGQRLRVRLPPDLPYVLADEQRLTNVLYNLVDNALKYAPRGEISIEAGHSQGRVMVWVADQGPGIPPAARELIFQKFQRLNGGDDQAVYGHGLGLYMVRRMLQAMGGDVRVIDSSGGACLHFWLPATEEADA